MLLLMFVIDVCFGFFGLKDVFLIFNFIIVIYIIWFDVVFFYSFRIGVIVVGVIVVLVIGILVVYVIKVNFKWLCVISVRLVIKVYYFKG